MKLELLTPIGVGQTALVQIYGHNEFGYVMVKVNGAYVTALPGDSPGTPNQHRSVFGPPSGRGFNVWTNPQWKAHDSVLFELYDDATKTLQSTAGTVIL